MIAKEVFDKFLGGAFLSLAAPMLLTMSGCLSDSIYLSGRVMV
jgi:hypothetical protein